MPVAIPEEFRHCAVRFALLGQDPTVKLAKDLGTCHSGLRRWVAQSDVENGTAAGITRDEHSGLLRLRRESQVVAME